MKRTISAVFAVSSLLFANITGARETQPFSLPELKGDRLEAMEFLYQYLPLPDKASYTPEFFLRSVDVSLKAREEMPWGRDIPEREFRHFVLPLRVNNEMLDTSRYVFYNELKDRVKNLTIEEAILEVNHWCHEKVTYQPSDGRTSNPLSTVSQAIGRCGEESTFTVAALRAVGIPARQVYTPRWAHTDDNHAWVEAWANGEWHFIGACEPEPVLDLAWFNLPASRGMVMNTTVFGKYDGPEEKFKETDITTTINVTPNYAPTGLLQVKVTDRDGNPVANVPVNFCIYNYAEFYPVTTKITNGNGMAGIVCGIGDMVAWSTDGTNYGFVKGRPEEGQILTLTLDREAGSRGNFELDIIPPAARKSQPEVSQEARETNNRRLAYEDSVRKAYTSTFADVAGAAKMAAESGWDKDKATEILPKTRGNHKVVEAFLKSLSSGDVDKGFALLSAVSEKDLRDITIEVIEDNMTNSSGDTADPLFVNYVLNPRVENEPLVPYKSYLKEAAGESLASLARSDPKAWAEWVGIHIEEDTLLNPQALHMNPVAVWNEKKADLRSKRIFFVASMRSFGIPARIDPVTGKTQYHDRTGWVDVNFSNRGATSAPASGTGKLNLTYREENGIKNPAYYSHFSIQKITDGVPRQLEFDEGATYSDFSDGLNLDEGDYLLLTGQRMSDGSVLVKGDFFPISSGETTTLNLTLRNDEEKVGVIGSLNSEDIYYDIEEGKDKSILSTTGRGTYILGIIRSNSEPSAHALNDISQRRGEFETLGEKMVILFKDAGEQSRYDKDKFPNLPSTVVMGVDTEGKILEEIKGSLMLENDELPLFVIADSFNRILYVSQGYTIGLGDRLIETLRKIHAGD